MQLWLTNDHAHPVHGSLSYEVCAGVRTSVLVHAEPLWKRSALEIMTVLHSRQMRTWDGAVTTSRTMPAVSVDALKSSAVANVCPVRHLSC